MIKKFREIIFMKILGKHILILGGFYFIISFLLDLGQGYFFNILEAIVACCFIVMFLCLCFKRKFLVFETFQHRFPRTVNYLSALGVLEYIGIIFGMIPGLVYGYRAAEAEYNGLEYVSIFPQYMSYFSYIYIVVFVLALLCTLFIYFYQNFNY